MIYKNFSVGCKIKLFYGVAIALSAVFINGSLYASTALTAEETALVRNASVLLEGKGWEDDITSALQTFSESRSVPSPTLKPTLSSLHDTQGNTLAHYFVNYQKGKDLYRLLQITGFAILDKTNTAGKKPFSNVSLEELRSLGRQIQDAGRGGSFHYEIGAYLAPLLREKVVALIANIESQFLSSERATEGLRSSPLLDDVIKFSPMVLAGQKLENFSHYFENFLEIPEGRNLLRTYRLADGSSLLSYYEKQLAGLEVFELEKPIAISNIQNFYFILNAYVFDGVMITSRDLDILEAKDLVFCLKNMPGSEGVENSTKRFWTEYRNSKGRNLLRLIFDANDDVDDRMDFKIKIDEIMYELRSKIGDNTAFLTLFKQTSLGHETAEKRLMKTAWGLSFIHSNWGKKFWEAVDVSSMVTPGKYGVTPLMKMATAEYLEPLLERLREKRIPITQVDAFGNTVESIRRFCKSDNMVPVWAWTGKEILVENFKRRPLQDSLWNDYLEYPYSIIDYPHPTIVFPNSDLRTIEGILYVVRQQPQTSLHRAFLQIEINDDQGKANSLWRSLFKAYDNYNDRALAERRAELSKRKLRAQSRQYKSEGHREVVQIRLSRYEDDLEEASQHILEKRAMPLAERALAALSVRENSEAVETILATGGTFGINFSRKVSPLGGRVVMQRCKELGRHLAAEIPFGADDIEKANIEQQKFRIIKDSLFRDFGSVLDSEKEEKLLNHRLNCAVMTLFAFMDPDDLSYMRPKTDKQFSKIDAELQSVLPAGQKVNSRARFERLYGLYGETVLDNIPYYP